MPIDLITATHEDFAPFVGQAFIIKNDDMQVELTLDNIKVFEKATVRENHLEIGGVVYPPRVPFALTFVGPLEPILPAQTYAMENNGIGKIELFVSAFQQDQTSTLYESIIS